MNVILKVKIETLLQNYAKYVKMLLTEKIRECCYYYSLCDKNVTKAMTYVNNVSRATFSKYVRIGEMLEYNILMDLDKKGKSKLTVGFAEDLATTIYNPDFQLQIYDQISNLSNKQKKEKLPTLLDCLICCEKTGHQIRLPCCNTFICIECLYTHMDTIINDIAFVGIKCPCCNVSMKEDFIRKMLLSSKHTNLKWMNNIVYLKDYIRHPAKKTYYHNLLRKLLAIIRKTERIVDKNIDIQTFDFDELVLSDEPKYFGICQGCCPEIRFHRPVWNFNSIKVTTVDKQCVNGEGNIVVLKPEMFTCKACKGEEDVEIKKCPHCGVRTVKPDGCNYVVCKDHRWCWICNERLEINHEGHNVHYWMGPGTGPYSDECRQSMNYDAPKFILPTCNCYYCHKNGGKRLCKTLECNNLCKEGEEICGKC